MENTIMFSERSQGSCDTIYRTIENCRSETVVQYQFAKHEKAVIYAINKILIVLYIWMSGMASVASLQLYDILLSFTLQL